VKLEKGIISFDDDIKQTHEYWREERIKQVMPIPMLNMAAEELSRLLKAPGIDKS
jgi:hypothetical protein